MAKGLAPSTAARALATRRSILAFAVADTRVQHNVAAAVRRPTSGQARREGRALTPDELRALMEACQGRYHDAVPVPVPAPAGLRRGELAGLQVGDRVSILGPGLRLRRTVLASGGGCALYVDSLESNRGRAVPLVLDLVPPMALIAQLARVARPTPHHGDHRMSATESHRRLGPLYQGLWQAGDVVDLHYPPFFVDRVEDVVSSGPQVPCRRARI